MDTGCKDEPPRQRHKEHSPILTRLYGRSLQTDGGDETMNRRIWAWLLGGALGLVAVFYPVTCARRAREKAMMPGMMTVPRMAPSERMPSAPPFGGTEFAQRFGYISSQRASAPVTGKPKTASSPVTLTAVRTVAPDRQLIKTAELVLETDKVSHIVQQVIALAKEKGGYVLGLLEEVSLAGEHTARLQVRVPAEAFEESLLAIEKLGKVRSKRVQADDVTEEFLDIQSRLTALRTSMQRIQKMMEGTDNLDTLMRLENELAMRRSQVEGLEGRLRYLRERTAFCTIHLTITEFKVMPTPAETWAAVKVAADAWRELQGVLRVLATFGIWLGIWSILWLPLSLIGIGIMRFAFRRTTVQ